mmetsp:Transcript_28808/g.73452  ORF Transcript_28808/g.73452 Transcript_28808/m.73452 type:complete len:255 (+) Transcript_28808:136-900(+)
MVLACGLLPALEAPGTSHPGYSVRTARRPTTTAAPTMHAASASSPATLPALRPAMRGPTTRPYRTPGSTSFASPLSPHMSYGPVAASSPPPACGCALPAPAPPTAGPPAGCWPAAAAAPGAPAADPALLLPCVWPPCAADGVLVEGVLLEAGRLVLVLGAGPRARGPPAAAGVVVWVVAACVDLWPASVAGVSWSYDTTRADALGNLKPCGRSTKRRSGPQPGGEHVGATYSANSRSLAPLSAVGAGPSAMSCG